MITAHFVKARLNYKFCAVKNGAIKIGS
jgi:hypothetical protein